MEQKKYKILFLGTPQIAAEVLRKLLTLESFEVVGVVTKKDKFVGRKKILTPSPVKKLVLDYNKLTQDNPSKNIKSIPIFHPKDASAFLDISKNLNQDINIVVAYGRILSEEFINFPRLGSINLHYSLLPSYKGATPAQTTILNGDRYGGYTIQKMVYELDSGGIIFQKKFDISSLNREFTSDEYLDFLTRDCIANLEGVLKKYITDPTQLVVQDKFQESFCDLALFSKTRAEIDPNKLTAEKVFNKIKAFNPEPLAYVTGLSLFIVEDIVQGNDKYNMKSEYGFFIIEKKLNLINCKNNQNQKKINTNQLEKIEKVKYKNIFFVNSKKQLFLCTMTELVEITEIQSEGSRVMSSRDYINGQKI